MDGKEGKALSFEADQERFLKLPQELLGDEPQVGVMEFWIRPEKGDTAVIFGKATSAWGDFVVSYVRGGGIRVTLQGDRITSICQTKAGSVPLKKWTHVRIVWDIRDANRVYIDGRERAARNPIRWIGGDLPTTVGCAEPDGRKPSQFFTGAIDELRIMAESGTAARAPEPAKQPVQRRAASKPVELRHDPAQRECRMLFAHHCVDATREEIDATIARMKTAQMNVIAPQVLAGYALWNSKIVMPYQRNMTFDPLAYLVQQAHANGIEVHGVFDCFHLPRPDYVVAGAPGDRNSRFDKRKIYRSQPLPNGACFHDEEYRSFFAAAVREVCLDYSIDGVNLDLVRTGGRSCLCSDCVRKYRERFGRDLAEDATYVDPWIVQWHEEGIGGLVKAVSDSAREVAPRIQRSICAYVPSLKEPLQGQVADRWLEAGWLDFVCPMTYWPNARSICAAVERYQVAMPNSGIVFPLLSACHANTLKDTALFMRLLRETQSKVSVRGVGIYYHRFLTDDLAVALRAGPFREPAIPPWAPPGRTLARPKARTAPHPLEARRTELRTVASYSFDEGNGYLAGDSTASQYDGIANKGQARDAAWVTGKRGAAMLFDADEERFLRLPTAVLKDEPQAGSIEFWIRPQADSDGAILSKYTTGWGKFFIMHRQGGLIAFVTQGDRVSSSCQTKPGSVPLNRWTHVEVVWDIDDADRILINGVEHATQKPVRWRGGRHPTTVGCMEPVGQDPKHFFTGALDELKIVVKRHYSLD